MYAPGTSTNMSNKESLMSRGGPMIAVVGLHVLIIYGLMTTMGIVKIPSFVAPMEAIFIPEQTETPPQPEIKPVKPEIDQVIPEETPPPEIQVTDIVAPPADMSPSENAIAASPMESAPAQDLKASSRVEPVYPPTSRRAGEEGTVRLKVLVDEKGRPRDVAVANSSGFPKLDDAAIAAVRKWKFVAATDGSNAISAWTQVAITFRLTNA